MFYKLIALLFLIVSCKARNSGYETKDIGQAGPGQTIIVFHLAGSEVFKRSCADYAATAAPAKCPPLAQKSWTDFAAGLKKQGVPDPKIDELKGFLQNPNLMHSESASVKPYMAFIDASVTATTAAPAPATAGKVVVPPPSGSDNPLDKAAVLAAMEQTRTTFNMPKGTVDACLANNVPDWSDIVVHYYCQHGQARSCFTGKARGFKAQGLSGKESYEKAYEDCKTDADFAWIVKNQPDVFRYLMFSVYDGGGVKTFKQEDQDWVINKFYLVNDPNDINECNKRYPRNNERRPLGSHCIDGSGGSPAGSGIVLEQGSYTGDNLTAAFCQVDQTIDPETVNSVMTNIKAGWCGAAYSGTFQCSGTTCKGISGNVHAIEPMSPTKYKFIMQTGTSVFTKNSGPGAGTPAGGANVTLKAGTYKGSNLTAAFCKQNQIADPILANGAMIQVKLGWCGTAVSSTFNCQGKDCSDPNFQVKIISATKYTFTVKTDTATYDWESSSMTP